MKQILINHQQEGRRLDQVLSRYLTLAPAGFLHKMLRKKNITLNDKKATGAERVAVGDLVQLYLSEDTIHKFSVPPKQVLQEIEDKILEYQRAYRNLVGDDGESVQIVYENDALLILNKPIGVLSQKASDADSSLNEWALGYLLQSEAVTKNSLIRFKPSVANRLDRNTTGLVVVVKTLEAAREFAALQKSGRLIKTYHAIVCGLIEEPGSIQNTSEKEVKRVRGRQVVKTQVRKRADDDHNQVTLAYKPIAVNVAENLSLIAVRLYEGKIHQIRAQMSAIHHPLLGDYNYGDRVRNDEFKARFGIQSQLLHARSLLFPDMKESFVNLSQMSSLSLMATYPGQFADIAGEIFNH